MPRRGHEPPSGTAQRNSHTRRKSCHTQVDVLNVRKGVDVGHAYSVKTVLIQNWMPVVNMHMCGWCAWPSVNAENAPNSECYITPKNNFKSVAMPLMAVVITTVRLPGCFVGAVRCEFINPHNGVLLKQCILFSLSYAVDSDVTVSVTIHSLCRRKE